MSVKQQASGRAVQDGWGREGSVVKVVGIWKCVVFLKTCQVRPGQERVRRGGPSVSATALHSSQLAFSALLCQIFRHGLDSCEAGNPRCADGDLQRDNGPHGRRSVSGGHGYRRHHYYYEVAASIG